MKYQIEYIEKIAKIVADNNLSEITLEDGEKAIEKIKYYKIDVLVLDLFLPVKDGIEVLKYIKEHKIKIGLSEKGRKFSEEHKKKIGQALKGRTFSEEALEKNRKKHSVPIVQLTLDEELVDRFDSIKYATLQTGIRKMSIIDCCKGRRKSVYGFKWMYESDYNQIFNSEGR